jgi:hypothetical protein
VSFLDGALALALTDEEPVFAIDANIAKAWWVKPFLKLTRALPLNPAKPMATRTLIKAVQGGDPLVIFPEGRITVTGSLMKVYDGAAMVADKTGSMVVPIRIDGLERSFFSRLASSQVRRTLFPKVKVTILEPRRLTVAPEVVGRKRRAAAGTALYRIMSDLVFRTTPIETTVFAKIVAAAKAHGEGAVAVQDPLAGSLSYRRLLAGAAVLAGRLRAMLPHESTIGVMLPNANATCVTVLDDQLCCRQRQYPVGVQSGGGHHDPDVALIRGAGAAGARCRGAREVAEDRVARGHPRHDRAARQAVRPAAALQAARRPQARRSGGRPVHLGLGGRAQGRRAHAPQHPR